MDHINSQSFSDDIAMTSKLSLIFEFSSMRSGMHKPGPGPNLSDRSDYLD